MIDTDLPFLKNDLEEVIKMMEDGEEFSVRHRFKESNGKIVNTVIFNGRSFVYGNLIGENLDETEKKRVIKRYAKLSLYKALSLATGKVLPWGSLTGIRPTKLAYEQIEKTGEFKEYFTDVLKVSPKKAELTARVIEGQKGIYKKDAGTDFFVFIPFCPSRCNYCSFITQDVKSSAKFLDEYVKTLIKEIEEGKRFIKNLRSVYVGGGTPVSIPLKLLEEILKSLKSVTGGVEYTVEAGRPDAISKDTLSLLKDYGVNRICINPQTFNDRTLNAIGRNHTSRDIIEKYALAKDDFSVNMDLIAGLKGERAEDFYRSLEKAIELSPDGITVHTLAVKHGSYLAENGRYLEAGDTEKMVEYAHKRLEEEGYIPYYLYRQKYMRGCLENTGYAKKGKACVYNVDTMEEITRNVACGAGAISKEVNFAKNKIERYANPKDVATYIEKSEEIIREKAKIFS